jgi:hypothetical protein
MDYHGLSLRGEQATTYRIPDAMMQSFVESTAT